MNETLKKFTEEAKAAFVVAVTAKEAQDAIATIKDASESGTFRVIVSTEAVDRQGDIVKADGWDLKNYLMNPIVLWAHDYSALPIGVCTSIKVEGRQLIAEGKFAPKEANPFAQQVRALYDAGIIRATSVGFIPTEYDHASSTSVKQELLEFSFVPVPANPEAIRLNSAAMLALGLDKQMLTMKGVNIKSDDDEEKKPDEDAAPSQDEPAAPSGDAPAPEAPKEETPPAADPAPTEEKGAVADQIEAGAEWREMNERLDNIFTIVYAFCDAYYSNPSNDSFFALAEEMVKLMQEYIAQEKAEGPNDENGEAHKGIIGKLLAKNTATGKQIAAIALEIKAGRAISAKNVSVLKSAIEQLEKGMEAHQTAIQCHQAVGASLADLVKGADGDGDTEQGTDEEKSSAAAPNFTRSITSGHPATRKELNVLHAGREVLVLAKDAIENGIVRYNARIAATERERRAAKDR